MEIPVFHNGEWITYTVPSDRESIWSSALKLQVASVYAAFRSKGFKPSYCSVLAECYANKQMYKDIRYSKDIEERLQTLRV